VKLAGVNAYLGALLQQLSKNGDNDKLVAAVREQMSAAFNAIGDTRSALLATPYPFDHARKETSMGEFVLDKLPNRDHPVEIYYAADNLIGNFHRLRARSIGCLCAIAEHVESSIGLDPLPEPADDDAQTPAGDTAATPA
jgi:hypothetical protein